MAKLKSIKLPHFNNAAEQQTRKIPSPSKVIISMAQHIGAPCTPTVAVGDTVKIGEKIGDNEAFVSAPVHASISGKVTDIVDIMHISGKLCKSIVIESDNKMSVSEDIKPPVINSKDDFIKAVRESGSIGLGGAGFPTAVKLAYDNTKTPIDTLIVNGAECEPYITSDYREFMENSENVLEGIKLFMQYLDIPKAVIGIEADKPKAIELMKRLVDTDDRISVITLKSAYPQGAEKVLIYSATGRVVAEGELPSSTGCVVINVSTVGFIYNYIKTGMPLVNRRITVDGNIVNKPSNLIVPIGTLLHDIVKATDARKEPDKIILGGPMMGNCIFDRDTPIAKTNNAVLMFSEQRVPKTTQCIRCGRCVAACSMGLQPTELEHAFDAQDAELLKKLKINLCMNCGACTFVCPAKRNISEKNQLAKEFVRKATSK